MFTLLVLYNSTGYLCVRNLVINHSIWTLQIPFHSTSAWTGDVYLITPHSNLWVIGPFKVTETHNEPLFISRTNWQDFVNYPSLKSEVAGWKKYFYYAVIFCFDWYMQKKSHAEVLYYSTAGTRSAMATKSPSNLLKLSQTNAIVRTSLRRYKLAYGKSESWPRFI